MKPSEFVKARAIELLKKSDTLFPWHREDALIELLDRLVPDIDQVEGLVKFALESELPGERETFSREEVATVARKLLEETGLNLKLNGERFASAAGSGQRFTRTEAFLIIRRCAPLFMSAAQAGRAHDLLDALRAPAAVSGASSPPPPAGANGPSAPTEPRRSSYATLVLLLRAMAQSRQLDMESVDAAIFERMPRLPASRNDWKFSYDDVVWITEKVFGQQIVDWAKFHNALALGSLAATAMDKLTVTEVANLAAALRAQKTRRVGQSRSEEIAREMATEAAFLKDMGPNMSPIGAELFFGNLILSAMAWALEAGVTPALAIDRAMRTLP